MTWELRYGVDLKSGDQQRTFNYVIQMIEEAVKSTKPDYWNYTMYLNSLQIVLQKWFERIGYTEDLSCAIEITGKVVKLMPFDRLNHVMYLNNLGIT